MSEDTNSGRSLRQRITKTQPTQPKRRRSGRLEISQEESIEDIYRQVNSKTNFNPTPLETIYESPKGKSQDLKDRMGMVKLKRHFRFTPFYNPSKCKIRMRKNKVKQLKRVNGNLNKSVTISLEQVEKVLLEISEDENEENQIQCHFEKIVEVEKVSQKISEDENEENQIPSSFEKVEDRECENEQSQTYGPDLENFNAYDSFMEGKEDKLSSFHLNSESSLYEKKFEEFLKLDDWPSPSKHKSDKSKRERRRSRRVLPLCINNSPIDIKSVNEHNELKVLANLDPKNQESNEQNKLSKSFKSLDPVVQVEPSSLISIVVPCDSSKSASKNSVGTHGRKKANKSRRYSGINRSLYKTYVDSSFNDSVGNIEESSIVNSNNVVIKNTPPPTSLMDQLRIGSPEPPPCNKFVNKKARRKSARLSVGKIENSCFGSVWTGTESPIKDNRAPEVDKPSTIGSITNVINKCSESELSSGYKDTCVTGPFSDDGFDKNKDSPVLSGIFNCQARLSKDKILKRKRGSSLTLSHFSFDS